jgi:hypothetical protein
MVPPSPATPTAVATLAAVWAAGWRFANYDRPQAKNDCANGYNRIYAAAEKQSKMLSGLRKSLSAT